MKVKPENVDLVIEAVLKLDPYEGERQNVLFFIQSCYGMMVRNYDLGDALKSLEKLTPEEQHALIEHIVGWPN